MSGGGQDKSQWLAVTEETLFLHDGLIRVTDLIELPYDVNTTSESDHEVVSFDSKSPTELSEKLMNVCGTQNNAYSRLLEYRLNALRGFWSAQQHLAFEEQNERETTSQEETLALLKKHNLWKEPEQAPFSTRVSVLLVLPLLQSQSKFDPSLCGITAELLLNCLRDCAPLSLSKEPVDCLNGLENLLARWLGEKQTGQEDEHELIKNVSQKEKAAAAFVALACARGHLKMFLHTVHLLLTLGDLGHLPVADLLEKLLETEGGQTQPSAVCGNRHMLCWGFEDMLSVPEKEASNPPGAQGSAGSQSAGGGQPGGVPGGNGNQPGAGAAASGGAAAAAATAADKSPEYDMGRSVATCGKFLYTTNSSGKGLVKVGTGTHGTLRGYIYTRNADLAPGRVAYASGVLFSRPLELDKDAETQYLADIIDVYTLQPIHRVAMPEDCVVSGPITTVAFCSDGDNLAWIWCCNNPIDKNLKVQSVFLDLFKYDAPSGSVTSHSERVLLLRKEEGSVKSLNETLLARLRPYRSASMAATLVTLTGTEPQIPRKEEATTTVGIPLKTLVKTPAYCDGTSVVFLIPAPGGGSSNAARSLFGSGASLSSLRLATNLCFDVADGQFNCRSDLMDASTCALARGASVLGIAMCYDVLNNFVWMVSNDWVDQFCNPGHQAWHHIQKRLGIEPGTKYTMPADNHLSTSDIIQYLLEHAGAMCLHQLNNDLLTSPMGSYLLQHRADVVHMGRVVDVMEHALKAGDRRTLTVGLVVMQLLFRMNSIDREDAKVTELIGRVRKLVWEVLDRFRTVSPLDQSLDGAVLREVCRVISVGLSIMYPEPTDRWTLLRKLLSDSDEIAGMCHLRDLILIEFADQLRNQILNTEEQRLLRLSDDLVSYILKIAVKESFDLLRQCQTIDKSKLDKLLASTPMASPCLRYLMALQCHLLRECVLHKDPPGPSEDPPATPTPQNVVREDLAVLQGIMLKFASNVFKGAFEVLEVLLETCNTLIHAQDTSELEYWLQGLERVSKATILGHLVPVCLTAMTHRNMRCLTIADRLMPQLVQLVVLTSQAALLLKSQVQAVRDDDLLNDSQDTDIVDLIGEAINIESVELHEKEEEGFLSGLKIPAPWTSGKSLESIHPVRDNYKLKEVVHIPGARCLFLRFDPRCSSQYDYDKLVVYAGPNTNSRRVAEYGGNTFGYGSRSVLGSGWPKDLVKVEGDTVTFSFEMRSGREHNTPDKAMWGFLVTVRAQDSTEEVASGLPFLPDLALGLSVLACTMLHLLYQGPARSREEEACQHLLKAKLLQRCVWQHDEDLRSRSADTRETPESTVPASPGPHRKLARIKLPTDIIAKLRELSGKQAPPIRPSIKEAIQPDVLEESIISAAIKHSGLADTVRDLGSHEEHQTEEYLLLIDLMSEVYRHTYAMIRQLQTIAELEQKWKVSVEEVRQGSMAFSDVFFLDYHLVENKTKELAILCFLKDISMDAADLDTVVTDLRMRFEFELSQDPPSVPPQSPALSMPKTRSVVSGVLEKLELLLQVNMAPGEGSPGMIRSVSHMPDLHKPGGIMIRSDTDVLRNRHYTRSISAPSDIQGIMDDSVLEIIRLQKRRQAHKKGPASILQDLVEAERDRPPQAVLIDQLFSFIGSNPEKAVSCDSFLRAACVRWRRGTTRQQALVHMKELLTAATRVGGATHLVAAVTSVLQHGPRVDELTCGGTAHNVREAFAETMTSVVQLAARYPIACCNSIGLLCIIPYTRSEEKCLVRSGLVHLLDKLCSLTSHRAESSTSSEAQSVRHRVSSMAWAGFQVLSNRCVTWEQEDGMIGDELEHSGLARQVSTLLTNHLARATRCIGNEAAGTEALQEVLSLLNNLSRSRMGKAILSQPGCVSKLLSLLLDQRPSPKLVLIILQLCRVALPLMSTSDCDRVELPAWGQEVHGQGLGQGGLGQPGPGQPEEVDKELKVASLLLAKLGDFLVPGGQTTISSRRPSMDVGLSSGGSALGGDKDKGDDTDIQDGRMSVFVHKRDDQSSHEVIQPLLSSSETRPFRLAGGANMDKVVRLDREMTKHGRAEVTTEDAVSALRKAAKWAQMGLVVSTAPPVDTGGNDTNGASDKKKTAVEVVCKEKNAELARTDPVRPFISSHVANSMAGEVIALLHSLLTAAETHAAQTWATAVEKVISTALSRLPLLLASIDDLTTPHTDKDELMLLAKQVNAAFAALGGFEETIKPTCEVLIRGSESQDTPAVIQSISEVTCQATVLLQPPTTEDFLPPRYSDTVTVPVSRLRTPRNEPLSLSQLSVTESIVSAVQLLLVPQDSSCSPMSQPLPIMGPDGLTATNQICRVVSEIRTRACKVLATHLKDINFTGEFIQQSGEAIDVLKSLAKDCNTGDRSTVTEAQCERLRMLYRDCAKPPPPPCKTVSKPMREVTWHTSRSFPPVRSCLFSNALTGVTFLGDPSSGSGLPRGTLVYASQPIPQQAQSFYWEIEICSFGESIEESGPIFAFGFMPAAEKKDGAWTNPVGSCLFHNNGRAVHYNGSSLLQWRSARLDVSLSSGDVAGIGWERQADAGGATQKGAVFFTYNGRKLNGVIEDVLGNMWPVVHIQKKNTRIKASFGQRPFLYAEGSAHKNGLEDAQDVSAEIRETFGALPFCLGSDSDSEGTQSAGSPTSDIILGAKTPPGPPCRTPSIPKSLKEYNSEASVHYKLPLCYDTLPVTGPDPLTAPGHQDDESDVDDGPEDEPVEDHYALLVKAWEQKVFPTIRRRFRNEAERKDGLEQIRGALQLGMTDIARQTVEFLYEENGGIPRDLHLPTIDDIKEELAKFTIERVRKGTTVVIRAQQTQGSSGTTIIPKFAVRGMLKTFGLTGVVLDVDQPNELVQVESYLRSEGVLVRYWYPLDMLERPPQGYRKASIIGNQILDTSNIHIHRELLRCESVLARMYCRSALLELIHQCNSPAMESSLSMSAVEASVTPMAASAALLQELDVENLQLLSNELLAPPQPHGAVRANSLCTAQSSDQCLASHTCALSDILYHTGAGLQEELRVAIARAATQGEDYLIELSNQICMCLQTAPEMFPYEEFPVSETKISTDVKFPGASFLVVSCRADPKAIKKDTSLYKSPWARIFTYRGHRIKKTGQFVKQEVVSYPRDTSSSSNQSDQYSPVIIPADLVHVKIGVSPPPGIVVTIHAIPSQFPLAITYIETLVSQKYNFEYRKSDLDMGKTDDMEGSCQGAIGGESVSASVQSSSSDRVTSPWRTFDSVVVTPQVLYHIVELLGDYLWRSDSPALIKEYMFHLLAQTLRMLQLSERSPDSGSKLPPILGPHLTPSFTLLLQLNTELKKLYEDETKHWPSGSTLAGTGLGLGIGDHGRFSSYFHSLMEVSLAIAEVTAPILPGASGSSTSLESKPSTSSSSLPSVPTSPMASGKRKKLKAKRDRDRGSTTPKRSGSPRRPSESESPLSASPQSSSGPSASSSTMSAASSGSGVSLTSTKPEDMLWFHRALTMTQILRYIVNGDPIGKGVIVDTVVDAAQSLAEPTAHQRLLVLSGIPTALHPEKVKKAIRKTSSCHGGLFKDEIFLPVQQVLVKPPLPKGAGSPQVKPKTSAAPAPPPKPSPSDQLTAGHTLEQPDTKQELKGYAVIEIRSKVKLESIRKALYKNKLFLDNLGLEPDELVDIPEDLLTVNTVNSSLLTERLEDGAAFEDYLLHKLVISRDPPELSDAAMIALTEVFHSCFISEQRLSLVESRQESGYICLGKEQIMMQAAGNLMQAFFLNIKPAKKTFAEQVGLVLRRYGVPKVTDKDDSDKKSKSVKKTGKSSSSKEKMALGATAARTTPRDKKVKPKEIPEKSSKDAGSPEGASKPTIKQDLPREDDKLLTLDGFLSYVTDQIKQDVRGVWRALFSCGYDIHLERCACIDMSQSQQMSDQWVLDMDTSLVHHVNALCKHLGISPSRLHPHELILGEAQLSSAVYAPLQGVPLESIRLRFALLQSLNNTLETFFLPLVDLRPALRASYSRSMATLIAAARGIIFYDTKTVMMNRVLNATALRKPDQAAPEITLDPLENITGERRPPMDTNFCQALCQLSVVSSTQLCVRLAAGGDPTYAFNVRFTGEEVHGTSGSFRHFLWQVARELESSVLDLFLPCPSAASHRNKGKLILKPGPMTYADEKMLQFLGQLFAITIRADIPFGLDLLTVFWKNLVGLDLDPVTDLQEADILTYTYIKKFEMMESESELYEMYADQMPRFVYNSLGGDEVELIPNGRNTVVCWENRHQYVSAILRLRLSELSCRERVAAVRSGLACVLPLQLLPLMAPGDLELRTCGLPEVNLDFLKVHTMYQVGLMDTDPHIQYFWAVLETLSQDELCRFVKFSCNQERIPQTCPCRDGGTDTSHVPPYPMKIAPPDGPGNPDSRYIRVETCMFMIKLPQYSSQELMRERLLYAIHCREDPLSG